MSERVKQFGSGAIITALVIFTLTRVFGWIGGTMAEVPALKAQAISEFAHLNKSIDKLTESSIKTNETMILHVKSDTEIIKVLSETLISHDFMLKQMRDDCDEFSIELSACQTNNKD